MSKSYLNSYSVHLLDVAVHIENILNNHYLKSTNSPREAINTTILTKGRAIIINIFSVAAGFMVLLFAQILPVQNFGLLIAISMIGSGLGALTLLPLILLYAYRKKKFNQANKT